jgi:hypothetical protein
VGSNNMIAMWTHFRAACSLGKCPRVFTDSIAFVVQTILRISVSNRRKG